MLALLLLAAAQPLEGVRGFELRRIDATLVNRGNSSLPPPVFSADGALLAAADREAVRVWDTATLQERTRLHLPGGVVWPLLAFTADGRTVLVVDAGVARWFDPTTGKQAREKPLPQPKKWATAWPYWLSPAGDRVATADPDADPPRTVVLDPVTGEVRGELAGAGGNGLTGPVGLGGRVAAAALDRNQQPGPVRVWDAATGRAVRVFGEASDRPASGKPLAGSPDGGLVALSPNQPLYQKGPPTVEVWGVDDGRRRCVVPAFAADAYGQTVDSAALSADGRTLVLADSKHGLVVFDLVRDAYCPDYALPGRGTRLAVASRDGRTLAVSAWKFDAVGSVGSLSLCPFPVLPDPLPADGDLTGRQVNECLAMLASANEFRAVYGVKALAARPDQAVALLRDTAAEPDRRRAVVLDLIKTFDDDSADARDKALAELRSLAHRFEPLLSAASKGGGPGEVRNRLATALAAVRDQSPPADLLADLRAVEVLEAVGTPEAKAILVRLAGGAADSRLTLAAKAAVERLGKR
jgi:hypothetical protein